MRWITARNLEEWADKLTSRSDLPRLVEDLILATAPTINSLRFPNGDMSQIRGKDGFLDTSGVKSPYVPEGRSGWEFSVQKNTKAKVEQDFKAKVIDGDRAEWKEKAFVFVTARKWDYPQGPDLQSWVETQKELKLCGDIKVIDAPQLETWLDQCPAVSAKYAKSEFGLMPSAGVESLDEFWAVFSSRWQPAITEKALLCEREERAVSLVRELQDSVGQITLTADSPDEVVGFAIAAIRASEPNIRLFLEARTLVVSTEEAAKSFVGRPNLTFLLRGAATRVAGALSRSGATLVPIAHDRPRSGHDMLTRPSVQNFAGALQTMGLEEPKASEQARACGQSFVILSRIINPGVAEPPAWVNSGSSIVPALLAGAWDCSNQVDVEIVSLLAGSRPYGELEKEIRPLLRSNDPLLDCVGDVWKMRAPFEAFVYLGHLVGAPELRRFGDAVRQVFGQDYVPRPTAPIFGDRQATREPSQWIREGLATTLDLIAVRANEFALNTTPLSPRVFVDELVRTLPGLAVDYKRLASIGRQLPLLMEAAPNPLLLALEEMLEGDGKALKPLFEEVTQFIAPASDHTSLLWGLETLAWDPLLLVRVCLILSKLDAIDPGGRLMNRPMNSLRTILLPWAPNTFATATQRLAALDAVIAADELAGWRLLQKLFPKGHDTSSPTLPPRYRSVGPEKREVLINAIVWQSYEEIADRSLQLAGDSADRWCSLIAAMGQFSPASRARIVERLEAALDKSKGVDRLAIWRALHDEVNRHLTFADADWALASDEIKNLSGLVERYPPDDFVEKNIWLFDDWTPYIPGIARADLAEIKKVRAATLGALDIEREAAVVLRLARECKLPQFVADALAELLDDIAQFEEYVALALSKADNKLLRFAETLSGIANVRFGAGWKQWIADLKRKNTISKEQFARLLFPWDMNFDTWRFAESMGAEFEREYWLAAWPHGVKGDTGAVVYACEKLKSAGRAIDSLGLVLQRLGELSNETVFEILDMAAREIAENESHVDNMVSYHISEILKHLRARQKAPPEEIARREYVYLPLLENGAGQRETAPLAIHGLMLKDPSFYVSILCDVFVPDTERGAATEEEVDPIARNRARLGYTLLCNFRAFSTTDSEQINVTQIEEWVKGVREKAVEADRGEIADLFIGRYLAHSPPDGDGVWPERAFAELIERLQSEIVERGIRTERFNMRGVYSKSFGEGGAQERALEATYRMWADKNVAFPRVVGLLSQIADVWSHEAKSADTRAEQDKLRD